MANKLTASFVLLLEDKLSAGLAKLEKQLSGLADLGKKLTLGGLEQATKQIDAGALAARKLGDGLEWVERRAASATHALGRMASGAGNALKQASERVGVVGAAAAGISVMAPIKAAAEREWMLRHIAITKGLRGDGVNPEISRLDKKLNQDALETGQRSGSVVEAYSDLVQAGIPANQVDAMITAHSRAATAYNVDAKEFGGVAVALMKNLGITDPGDFSAAVSAIATAAKKGRFKVADFSRELPGIAGSLSFMGMKGRFGSDTAAAALETVMQNASEPSQAAADVREGLSHMVSHAGILHFQRQGIDLIGTLERDQRRGISPLDSILTMLKFKIKGLSAIRAQSVVKTLFPDQQSGDFFMSLLQHEDEFKALRKELAGVTEETAKEDFKTAYNSPQIKVNNFEENLGQLERRVGGGFAPALAFTNDKLDVLSDFLKRIDDQFPGLSDKVLLGTAGFLSLLTVLGAIGVVAPAIGAGLALLASPAVLLAGYLAAVVVALDAIATKMGGWGKWAQNGEESLRDGISNWYRANVEHSALGGFLGMTSPVPDKPTTGGYRLNPDTMQYELRGASDPASQQPQDSNATVTLVLPPGMRATYVKRDPSAPNIRVHSPLGAVTGNP